MAWKILQMTSNQKAAYFPLMFHWPQGLALFKSNVTKNGVQMWPAAYLLLVYNKDLQTKAAVDSLWTLNVWLTATADNQPVSHLWPNQNNVHGFYDHWKLCCLHVGHGWRNLSKMRSYFSDLAAITSFHLRKLRNLMSGGDRLVNGKEIWVYRKVFSAIG